MLNENAEETQIVTTQNDSCVLSVDSLEKRNKQTHKRTQSEQLQHNTECGRHHDNRSRTKQAKRNEGDPNTYDTTQEVPHVQEANSK